jgi:hypothetical protein
MRRQGVFLSLWTALIFALLLAQLESPAYANERKLSTNVQTVTAGAGAVGTGPFVFLPAVTYPSGGVFPSCIRVADVNGDGKLDLVVANASGEPNVDGVVGILLGNGDGTFKSVLTYDAGGYQTSSVAVADVNGDGKPDLVVSNFDSPAIGVLLGNGDGTFRAVVTYQAGFGAAVAIADVNGDGKPDIVVANGGVGVLLGNGDGTFQAVYSVYDSGGAGTSSIAVGDLNGDGRMDLVVTNPCHNAYCGAGEVSVLLGSGDGSFQAPVVYESGGYETSSVAIGDLNGDGRPDLIVTNQCADLDCINPGTIGVLIGKGDGTFEDSVTYSSGTFFADSVSIGDVNGDGKPDLVVASLDVRQGMATLFGNGDGTFLAAVVYNAAWADSDADSVAMGDFNGDGKQDLALAVSYGNFLSVMLNNSGFPSSITSLTSNINPVDMNKQSVTYTATVSITAGGNLSGGVTLVDSVGNGSSTVTVPLVNNIAVYDATYRSRKLLGAHSVTATYSGQANVAEGSASSVLTEYVRGDTTQTAVSTSGSPSQFGQAVTFTASISSKYGPITDGDTVTFYDGSTVLGSVVLAGAQATFTTSSLSAKKHVIKALFAGDNKFEPSTGHIVQLVEH